VAIDTTQQGKHTMQKFYANPIHTFAHPNGATGYGSGGPFDCLGPYAKVTACPIEGTPHKRTAYATGYADTYFSIPAATRYKGRYIGGYFTNRDDGVVFVPFDRFLDRLTA
jgi:hypothetical protein